MVPEHQQHCDASQAVEYVYTLPALDNHRAVVIAYAHDVSVPLALVFVLLLRPSLGPVGVVHARETEREGLREPPPTRRGLILWSKEWR